MKRKIIIGSVVVLVSGALFAYFTRGQVVAPSISEWAESVVRNATESASTDLPANFSEKIVEEINIKRKEDQLIELKTNEDLSKVAKARLAVIVFYDDYSGEISSLTREKALELVDYQSTTIGDVFLSIQDKEENFLERLLNNKIEKETLLHPKFTEVGIAELKRDKKNYFYLIFGNKVKKVPVTTAPTQKPSAKITWGGPDLWETVNKRRVEFGVGQLTRKDELCTIASIRLNQLLELRKLDGHAGFQPVLERSDLKWIAEKYNISEYLATGYSSPQETVKGWENTLGHKSLLTGGEYVWGCIYAQNSYAVAITAY